jgi:hypothetical protein
MLAVQGVVMGGAHAAAVRANDDAALRRYAELARQGGRQLFTMDPTQIALTDQGFRRKHVLGALSPESPSVGSDSTSARLAVTKEGPPGGDRVPVGAALALLAGAAGLFAAARRGARSD